MIYDVAAVGYIAAYLLARGWSSIVCTPTTLNDLNYTSFAGEKSTESYAVSTHKMDHHHFPAGSMQL